MGWEYLCAMLETYVGSDTIAPLTRRHKCTEIVARAYSLSLSFSHQPPSLPVSEPKLTFRVCILYVSVSMYLEHSTLQESYAR